MNVQQLKYYVELCKYKSFTKASDHLFISQQGLSMAIIRLETEFSCKFFERTPRGLLLTGEGEFFLERAKSFLELYDQCEKYFHSCAGKNEAFDLAVAQGSLGEFGAYCIKGFLDSHTQYRVNVREYQDRACDMAVDNMDAEVGLGIEPMDDGRFEHHQIFTCRAGLVLRKDHPLAKAGYQEIPSSCLQGLSLVTVDERMKTADYLLDELKKEGIIPRVRFRVGEIIGVHRLAMENIGAGLTNMSITKSLDTPNTVTIPLADPKFVWAVDLFKRKGAALSPAAEAFYQYMLSLAPITGVKPAAPDELEDFYSQGL